MAANVADAVGYDIVVLAYDTATGALAWTATYDGPTGRADVAFDMALSPDGARAFVTGYTSRTNSPWNDVVTIAFDTATGAQAWAATHAGLIGIASAETLAVSPDGATVFVAGDQNNGNFALETLVLAYDAFDGKLRWATTYAGAGVGSTIPAAIAVSPDGSRVAVAGETEAFESWSDDNLDYATIVLDARSGSRVWEARYDGPAHGKDVIEDVVFSADGGGVFVTGLSDTGPAMLAPKGPWWDVATLAYDAATGEETWLARYNGPLSAGDQPVAMARDPTTPHRFFVAGMTEGTSGTDMLVLAYDAS